MLTVWEDKRGHSKITCRGVSSYYIQQLGVPVTITTLFFQRDISLFPTIWRPKQMPTKLSKSSQNAILVQPGLGEMALDLITLVLCYSMKIIYTHTLWTASRMWTTQRHSSTAVDLSCCRYGGVGLYAYTRPPASPITRNWNTSIPKNCAWHI